MLEFFHKDFKVAIKTIVSMKTKNILETNGKIKILSKERNISNKEIGYVKKNPI